MNRNQTVGVFVFSIAFFVVGVCLMIYSSQMRSVEDTLAARGVHVQGQVLSVNVQGGGFSGSGRNSSYTSPSYYLGVQYPVGQVAYVHSFECSHEAFTKHPYGSQVEVVYDPQSPDVARLGGSMNGQTSGLMTLVALGAMVIGAGAGIGFNIYSRRLGPAISEEDFEHSHAVWTNDPLSEEDPGNIPVK